MTRAIQGRSPRTELCALLAEPGILIALSIYDGFSLCLVEQAAYKTTNFSGADISESHLGWTDAGIMGYTENLRASGALASISSIPLAAEGATGYGSALNVDFTVQDFERAGLACLMIEDQVWPKGMATWKGSR